MRLLLSLAAAAAAYAAGPAVARESAPAPSVAVGYADLDLSSEAGRRTLDARLASAVRTVCGTASDADLHGKNQVARCLTDTARAVAGGREAALASARAPAAGQIAAAQ
jgi:UrcA family protein